MSLIENPFTPSFGEIPVHFAGRKELIVATERAFESQRRRPELTTIFSGARGTGKTALLSFLAKRAEERGWIAVNVTALPGMLKEIEVGLRNRAAHLIDTSDKTAVSGIGIPQIIDVHFESQKEPTTWRSRMTDLLEQLDAIHVGLLITVDEVDPRLDEMIQLAAIYQHFVREERRVALLMAGLPHNISALLNDKTASFLRRAQSADLGRIADYEIEVALRKTIQDGGREADIEGLDYAVKAIEGFPFMLQLVGYHAWDISPASPCVLREDFRKSVQVSRKELRSRVFESTLDELSDGDIAFAEAMLEDKGDSTVADLIERLHKSPSSVSQHRRRLIDAGIIGERRRGVVGFDMPFFREFLQEKLAGDR